MLSLVWLFFAATPAGPHCPVGYEPIGDEACLAAPKPFKDPNKLIIYFHGILPPRADWAAVQEFKVLGQEATRRGYALLAMRGEQGLCYWGGQYTSYYCWPSDKSQLPDMERMLRRLKALMPKVGERLESRIGP